MMQMKWETASTACIEKKSGCDERMPEERAFEERRDTAKAEFYRHSKTNR